MKKIHILTNFIKNASTACLFFIAILLSTTASIGQNLDNKGKDFYLMFNSNIYNSGSKQLFITSDVNTSGTVSGSTFSTISFSVTANTITTVSLPNSIQDHTSDVVDNKGFHIVANDDIAIYGLNQAGATTDAYLGLPTDVLGTDYMVLTYKGLGASYGSQLGVVATENSTVVTITPSVTVGSHPAGTAYTVSMNAGQSYQLETNSSTANDLTGSIVTSNKPIGVFGASRCSNIPTGYYACDAICEMMPPRSTWGTKFGTVPLKTRTKGDTWRFLATENGTTITIDGTAQSPSLNQGQYLEKILTSSSIIESNKPILVAQYSNGTGFDNVTSDPFIMLIPPIEQFQSSYTVGTPASGFSGHYVNLIVPNSVVGSLTFDGSAISSSEFTAIGSSGYSSAKITVSAGSHTFISTLPFGVFSYGFGSADSYGYAGGQSFSPVATVNNLDLSPATGTSQINVSQCWEATVTDQNNDPVVGVKVDFDITGPNSTLSGFANTDSSGVATFCYTGTNGGNDSIYAHVGAIGDNAVFTWTTCVAPQITCPSNMTMVSDSGICGANVTFEATATGTSPNITYSHASGSLFPVGSTVVTSTATNDCGTDSCTFTITVNDNEAPIIEGENVNITVKFDVSPGAPASYTEADITFLSLYGNSSHVHLGDYNNDGSGDLYNHSNCCSTPYRLTVGNGVVFSLLSMDVKRLSGNPIFFVYPIGDTVSITSTGIFTFPSSFANVTEIRWHQDAGGMAIDNMIVSTKTTGSCPKDITVLSDSGKCGANVTYSASATDNCSANVTFNPASGSFFSIGSTTVTATATDPSNNTSTCTFVVTVKDEEAPAAICKTATVQLDSNGAGTITVSDIDNGSNDACGIKSVSIDKSSFSCADVGANTVILTVTDNNDNVSTCSTTVTVNDAIAPIAIAQNLTINLDSTGNASITAAQVNNGSNDACGVTLAISQSDFDCSDVKVSSSHKDDYALDFTNGNDYVVIGVVTPASQSYTKEAWVKAASTSCDNIISSNQNPFWISGGYLRAGNGNNYSVVTDPNTFTANTWTHVAVTYDASTTTMRLYKNGTQVAVNTNSPGNSGGISSIGKHYAGGCHYSGQINEVRIWNYARSASELSSNLGATLMGNESGLTAYYPMEEGTGSGTSDVTGNGFNGTFSGMASNPWVASNGLNIGGDAPNTITLTVTDGNNNVSTTTSTITVLDAIAPNAICKNITVQLDSNGAASIAATDIDNGSNDACGIQSISIDKTSFDCDDAGTNTVTLTVTDNNNNVSTCTSTVTVKDEIAPTAICKNITVALDSNGTATISAADIDNGSYDNCGIVSKSIDVTSFSCSDVGQNPVVLFVQDAANNGSAIPANLVGHWKFDAGIERKDLTGNWGDLILTGSTSISGGKLDVNANTHARTSSYTGPTIGNKTLISWMSLDQLTSQGKGSAMTIDKTSVDEFDGIIFAENQTNRWLSGSSYHRRTSNLNPGFAESSANQMIMLAITYEKVGSSQVKITFYRNGTAYGSYTSNNFAQWSASDAEIIFGARHFYNNSSTQVGWLDAHIDEAMIFNRALTAAEISGLTEKGSICTSTVTVIDNIAPIALCNSFDVQLDSNGSASITAAQVNNGSNDACGIKSVSIDKTSFSCANVGPNAVTLTVTDNNDNVSTCIATITVKDEVAPIAICKNITVQLDNNGAATIAATDVDNGSNDACGIKSISIDKTSFSCANVGANTVTLTVTDNNDNVSTCTATVTVKDEVAPIAICNSFDVQLDNTGSASITVAQVNNGSNDACGIKSVSIDKSTFDCSHVGTNAVTLTVTDKNDNVSTCVATITVKDEIAPIAICKNVSITLANGTASITAADINDGSNDACGIKTVSASKTTFACEDLGANSVVLTVTDNNQNVSTCTATVNVLGDAPSCTLAVTPDDNTYTGGVATNMYIGYGPTSSTITCSPTGGSSFSFSWSGNHLSGSGNAVTFTPTTAGNHTIICTVTNNNGCVTTCSVTICVKDIQAGGSGKNKKVYLCHVPPGNPNNPQSLSVSINSIASHLSNHSGDALGMCTQTCGSSKRNFNNDEIVYAGDDLNISVYPNPSSTDFTFEVETDVDQEISIVIMDMTGKQVIKMDDIMPHQIVKLGGDLATGMYLAKVRQGENYKVIKITKSK